MSELIVYKLSLDVSHPGCEKQVNLVSGETNSRILHITLKDGAVAVILNPITDVAVIRGIKADKKIVYNAAKITDLGIVEYAFTEQDAAVAGDGYYEVQIIRVEEERKRVIYSAWFKVHVGEKLYQDEKITSLSEYTALTEAVANAKKAVTDANEFVAVANEAVAVMEETQQSVEDIRREVSDLPAEVMQETNKIVDEAVEALTYVNVENSIKWNISGDATSRVARSNVLECDKLEILNVDTLYTLTSLEGSVLESKEKGQIDLAGSSSHTIVNSNNRSFIKIKCEEGVYVLVTDAQGNQTYVNGAVYDETIDLTQGATVYIVNAIPDTDGVVSNKAFTYIMYAVTETTIYSTTLNRSYDISTGNVMLNAIYSGPAELIEDLSIALYETIQNYNFKILQQDLTKYVPASRSIASFALNKDITVSELSEELAGSDNGLFSRSTFLNKIRERIYSDPDITLLRNAKHTHDNKEFLDTLTQAVIDELTNQINTALSIAKGAQKICWAYDIETLVNILNSYDKTSLTAGQSIYIYDTNAPDLWVCGIRQTSVDYTYTSDEDFKNELAKGYITVGYYVLTKIGTDENDLEGYVPTTRKIAGKALTSDVTNYDIINAIKATSEFTIGVGEAMVSQFNIDKYFEDENVLTALNKQVAGYLKDKPTIFNLNGEDVPTNTASDYPGAKIGDICINESYKTWICQYLGGVTIVWSEILTPLSSCLSNFPTKDAMKTAIETAKEDIVKSDEWQLLHQYNLEEDTATIIDFDTFDFANKYKEVKIQFNGVCSVANVPIYIYINSEANLMNIANCTSAQSCRHEFIFSNDNFYTNTMEFKHKVELKRTNSNSNVTDIYSNWNYYLEDMTDLKSLKMIVNSTTGTFPAGTRISIWGKEA